MQDFFHQQYVSLPEGIRYVGNHWLWQGGGSFQIFLEFSPWKLGKISILTNIFQMGWNHQLHEFSHFFKAAGFARLFESAACFFLGPMVEMWYDKHTIVTIESYESLLTATARITKLLRLIGKGFTTWTGEGAKRCRVEANMALRPTFVGHALTQIFLGLVQQGPFSHSATSS